MTSFHLNENAQVQFHYGSSNLICLHLWFPLKILHTSKHLSLLCLIWTKKKPKVERQDNVKSMTLFQKFKTNIHGTNFGRLQLIYELCLALLETGPRQHLPPCYYSICGIQLIVITWLLIVDLCPKQLVSLLDCRLEIKVREKIRLHQQQNYKIKFL